MSGTHVVLDLSAYEHGELSREARVRVEAHLQGCAKCRAAYGEVRLGSRLASTLSVSNAPQSVWNEIQFPSIPKRHWFVRASFAGAIGLALVVFIVMFVRSRNLSGPSWEVTGLPGVVRLHPGEVLQTGSSSEAQIKIANIGQMTLDPNTRIRLVRTQPDEHRIALDRGKVEAMTWAPPRLFIVDTPSATAVDLGCKYTLEVEEDGSSLLHVTLGLVALERDKRETIVPAGAFCRTRAGAGPGTPFFEDSSAELQAALEKVDSLPQGPERTEQLQIVLRQSQVRDALSLWHLLLRLDEQSRGLIYDRLSQLLPPPAEVTPAGIMALDPKMVEAWKKIVSQLWQ
jgi:hypothetical protein